MSRKQDGMGFSKTQQKRVPRLNTSEWLNSRNVERPTFISLLRRFVSTGSLKRIQNESQLSFGDWLTETGSDT